MFYNRVGMVVIIRLYTILLCVFLMGYSNLQGQSNFGSLGYEIGYYPSSKGIIHKVSMSKNLYSAPKWLISFDLSYIFSPNYSLASRPGTEDGTYTFTRLSNIDIYSGGIGIDRKLTRRLSFSCGAHLGYEQSRIDTKVIVREWPKSRLFLFHSKQNGIIGVFPIGLICSFPIKSKIEVSIAPQYSFITSSQGMIGVYFGVGF